MAGAGREADKALMRPFALVAALLLLLGFASEASAHASLVFADPRDGTVLAQAPKTVQLRFNESVTAGAVNLIDASGKQRADAVVDAKDEAIKKGTHTFPRKGAIVRPQRHAQEWRVNFTQLARRDGTARCCYRTLRIVCLLQPPRGTVPVASTGLFPSSRATAGAQLGCVLVA